MKNYEYIIACLPDLVRDGTGIDVPEIIEAIISQCDEADRSLIDSLLKAFDSNGLTEEFYKAILNHKCRFIREYFTYDLDLRNTRVIWLNKALDRPSLQDCILPQRIEDSLFDDKERVLAVLSKEDILERERGLDDLLWEKIEQITCLDVFNLDLILAFVAKLQIVNRWLKLDEDTGRSLFRKLVAEIRQTYDNKKNNI